jgi:ubiquinone/menaquinone biosynthesis C-methylase UbiE
MGLGQRFLGGPHGHATDGSGGHIVRPRLYELVAAVGFLGRRRRIFDQLVALSGARAGDRVLDVGCGTGYLTGRTAHAVGPAGRVVGVDPSEPVIAYARRVRPPNCAFHIAGGEAVPEPDASFDVVVSSLAIHHIPPQVRPAALREMYRVLRPGGLLMIADFRPPSGKAASHLVGAVGGHAMQHNPVDQLVGLVSDAGFEVTGTGDIGFWLHGMRYVQAKRSI